MQIWTKTWAEGPGLQQLTCRGSGQERLLAAQEGLVRGEAQHRLEAPIHLEGVSAGGLHDGGRSRGGSGSARARGCTQSGVAAGAAVAVGAAIAQVLEEAA